MERGMPFISLIDAVGVGGWMSRLYRVLPSFFFVVVVVVVVVVPSRSKRSGRFATRSARRVPSFT